MNKPAMSWWTQLPSPVCRLCRQEAGDPEKLGEFMQKDNLNLHYFCLILSSGLPQRGEDDNGFHGFLPEDIKKEVTRASKKICFICKKKGAAIFCQNERCRRSFHLPCGRERGCISQFFGEYKSFCQKHSPAQVMQPGPLGVEDCILCCENLSVQTDLIQSPCCNHTIYHRNCMQQYAHSSAVHFFKCPQCNNREEFHEEMLRMGIHIPDREWTLILCNSCGSQGTHKACSFLQSHCTEWECGECSAANVAAEEIPGCSQIKRHHEESGETSHQEPPEDKPSSPKKSKNHESTEHQE
ncbi:PHD finger protein 7 isoform X4 [Ornithorhynchus anatinus]|uniref:PHD finger protein 7 isoform X4 n=1 Tax=Ornithorhynchus anatinus TaxID=9258 RepID=UPI0007AA7081|nr:PHD finger protein 7 isoform X4 [Ornithorhynchus anatinus]